MGNLGTVGIFFAGFFGGLGIFFAGCGFLWWCSLYQKKPFAKTKKQQVAFPLRSKSLADFKPIDSEASSMVTIQNS